MSWQHCYVASIRFKKDIMLVVTNDQQRKQRGMRTKEIIDSKDVLLLPRVSGSVSHFFSFL